MLYQTVCVHVETMSKVNAKIKREFKCCCEEAINFNTAIPDAGKHCACCWNSPFRAFEINNPFIIFDGVNKLNAS